MTQQLQPLLDRVLVLQDWGPDCHPGTNVKIPQPLREKQRPNTGIVAAVGPGRRFDDGQVYPLALQKGQHVMFAPAETCTKVQHDGQEHLMMREQDVFLVLSEPKKPEVAKFEKEGGSLSAVVKAYREAGDESFLISGLTGRQMDELVLDLGCRVESPGVTNRAAYKVFVK